jgi:hypothetical protein
MSKTRIKSEVRVNIYPILDERVEQAIARGWWRAFKHDDDPSEEAIREFIHNAVMGELAELFRFESQDR